MACRRSRRADPSPRHRTDGPGRAHHEDGRGQGRRRGSRSRRCQPACCFLPPPHRMSARGPPLRVSAEPVPTTTPVRADRRSTRTPRCRPRFEEPVQAGRVGAVDTAGRARCTAVDQRRGGPQLEVPAAGLMNRGERVRCGPNARPASLLGAPLANRSLCPPRTTNGAVAPGSSSRPTAAPDVFATTSSNRSSREPARRLQVVLDGRCRPPWIRARVLPTTLT